MSWIYEDLGIPRLQRNESQASFRKRVKEWEDRNGKGAYKKYIESVDRFGKSDEYRAITELAWESKLDQKRTYTTADAKDANREAAPKPKPLTSAQLDEAEQRADPRGFAIRNEPGYQESLAEEARENLQISPALNNRLIAANNLQNKGQKVLPNEIVNETKQITSSSSPPPNTDRERLQNDLGWSTVFDTVDADGNPQVLTRNQRKAWERANPQLRKGREGKWKSREQVAAEVKAQKNQTATNTALSEQTTNKAADINKVANKTGTTSFSDMAKDFGQSQLDKFNVVKRVKSLNPNTPGGAANLAKVGARLASSLLGPKDTKVTWARNKPIIAKTSLLEDELEDPWNIWGA